MEERIEDRRVRDTARRVDHHPGRLVEDDDVRVLVQDRERQILGSDTHTCIPYAKREVGDRVIFVYLCGNPHLTTS